MLKKINYLYIFLILSILCNIIFLNYSTKINQSNYKYITRTVDNYMHQFCFTINIIENDILENKNISSVNLKKVLKRTEYYLAICDMSLDEIQDYLDQDINLNFHHLIKYIMNLEEKEYLSEKDYLILKKIIEYDNNFEWPFGYIKRNGIFFKYYINKNNLETIKRIESICKEENLNE